MSEQAIQLMFGLFGSIISLIGVIFTGYMAFKMAQLNASQKQAAVEVQAVAEKAKEAAAEVKEVKVALQETTANTDAKLDNIAKVGEAVHTLVNSSMSAQLKISAVALRRIAEMTRHPDDLAAAQLAEKIDREHTVKQATVDAKAER